MKNSSFWKLVETRDTVVERCEDCYPKSVNV